MDHQIINNFNNPKITKFKQSKHHRFLKCKFKITLKIFYILKKIMKNNLKYKLKKMKNQIHIQIILTVNNEIKDINYHNR